MCTEDSSRWTAAHESNLGGTSGIFMLGHVNEKLNKITHLNTCCVYQIKTNGSPWRALILKTNLTNAGDVPVLKSRDFQRQNNFQVYHW